ncbi:hypothetical protein IMF27_19130 [Pseudomonas sp. PCH199]|uniref:hypothetical protein n=1 Tax=unclassified Pseudomonas TaxID=196821 RepID=UPI000BCCBFE5|nr:MULTISPECIES: hypothetical protein [unclassified Pseudomonas]MCW8277474.1 hypothetical protein [Pseudomonas sp. PCH199]PAM82407.1 hypothetical protein CES87_19500 [Pseudomonas sp. ERMR1:02]
MVSVKSNLHIVRASALYDLIVTASFMTPWTASLVFNGFAALSGALALDRPAPTLDGSGMLFANLLGSVVVVWSLWRLMNPSRSVGFYDALARVLFAIWQLFAVAHGASFLILGFTFFEAVFAIAQTLPLTAPRESETNAGRKSSGLGTL